MPWRFWRRRLPAYDPAWKPLIEKPDNLGLIMVRLVLCEFHEKLDESAKGTKASAHAKDILCRLRVALVRANLFTMKDRLNYNNVSGVAQLVCELGEENIDEGLVELLRYTDVPYKPTRTRRVS